MKLAEIAAAMRARLDTVQQGVLTKALFGGLTIVYERRGDTWRLAIGRPTKPPSTTEAEVVAAAFNVPGGTEWSWTIRKNRKQRITYQVAECTWIERSEGHPI